ncbi:MAG: hypothetical protein ACYS67_08040 [Planctomycetota bacterium]|jgi:hypothetical protein
MKKKYHIWIFLGIVFTVITAISFWGIWGAMVLKSVAYISFFSFVICYPLLWLIFWRKPKKKVKKSETKKLPGKMTYLYWSKDDSGKPVAKVIGEQEQKNEMSPDKIKQQINQNTLQQSLKWWDEIEST